MKTTDQIGYAVPSPAMLDSHVPKKTRRDSVFTALVMWFLVATLIACSLWGTRPPNAVPASASPQEFSAERAMKHVRAIAAVPHPIGSPANDAVRKYLIEQLTALG